MSGRGVGGWVGEVCGEGNVVHCLVTMTGYRCDDVLSAATHLRFTTALTHLQFVCALTRLRLICALTLSLAVGFLLARA